MADPEALANPAMKPRGVSCADTAIAARNGRSRAFCLEALAALPLLCGFAVYDDLGAWQAAVGVPERLEDFESYPEMILPVEGGQLDLDHFSIEADAQGDHEWRGEIGIRPSSWISMAVPDDHMGFLSSLELSSGGATYNRILFEEPISALLLDVLWTEDGYLDLIFGSDWTSADTEAGTAFVLGVVLDEPITSVDIACDHTWCFVDSVRWVAAPIPEPATASLVALGLAGLACLRGVRGQRIWPQR